MQAIQTRYLGPTNYRGARVSAQCDAGRAVVPWNHALNVEQNHAAACAALVARLGWPGTWISGALPGSAGYAHVCQD